MVGPGHPKLLEILPAEDTNFPARELGRGSTRWDQREEDIHTFHLTKNMFKKTWP